MQFQNITESEYDTIINQAQPHLVKILDIIENNCELLEGNCFYQHHTTTLIPELKTKQQNLISIGKKSKQLLEIGFNAGHSALLFLLSNPELKLECIDICVHSYTKPCFEYLHDVFGDRVRLYEGDGNIWLEKLWMGKSKYDTFHVDGSHFTNFAHLNFLFCREMSEPGNIVIWDDMHIEELASLWNYYTDTKMVKEIPILQTHVYPHIAGIFL